MNKTTLEYHQGLQGNKQKIIIKKKDKKNTRCNGTEQQTNMLVLGSERPVIRTS